MLCYVLCYVGVFTPSFKQTESISKRPVLLVNKSDLFPFLNSFFLCLKYVYRFHEQNLCCFL